MKFYRFNDPYSAVIGGLDDTPLSEIIDCYEESIAYEPENPVEIQEEKVLELFIKACADFDSTSEEEAIKEYNQAKSGDVPVIFLIDGGLY